MKKEYFIDRVGNISVQGPVISMDLARMVSEAEKKDSFNMEDRLTVTMTGQNFITFVKTLNNTVKAISERQKNNSENDTQGDKETTASKEQKKTDGSA